MPLFDETAVGHQNKWLSDRRVSFNTLFVLHTIERFLWEVGRTCHCATTTPAPCQPWWGANTFRLLAWNIFCIRLDLYISSCSLGVQGPHWPWQGTDIFFRSLATWNSWLLHRDIWGPFAICFLFKVSLNHGHCELTTLKENSDVTMVFIDIDISNSFIRWGCSWASKKNDAVTKLWVSILRLCVIQLSDLSGQRWDGVGWCGLLSGPCHTDRDHV